MWVSIHALPTQIFNFFIPWCMGSYFFLPRKFANKHTFSRDKGRWKKSSVGWGFGTKVGFLTEIKGFFLILVNVGNHPCITDTNLQFFNSSKHGLILLSCLKDKDTLWRAHGPGEKQLYKLLLKQTNFKRTKQWIPTFTQLEAKNKRLDLRKVLPRP